MKVHGPRFSSNLKKIWEQVDDTDIKEGAGFYQHHHGILRRMADFYEAPFVQTVEAFAALSPNTDVKGNLRSLASCLWALKAGGVPRCTTFNRGRDAAMGYLTGETSFLDTVKGKKITAFRHNLLYPTTSKRATIDGHMVCILENKNMTMRQALFYMRENYGGPLTVYDQYERAVVNFSQRVAKLPPPMVQGILWTTRRRLHNTRRAAQNILLPFDHPQDYPPILDDLSEWRAYASVKKVDTAGGFHVD